jgi:1,4-alpha-glucan branching enzyme
METAKTKGRKKVTLECAARPKCEVYVAGTFNGWNPKRTPMKPVDGDGRYRTTLLVPPGRHEYKFVIGNQWRIDENNDAWVPNDFGSLNSLLKVG